jgi:hypothetical protein
LRKQAAILETLPKTERICNQGYLAQYQSVDKGKTNPVTKWGRWALPSQNGDFMNFKKDEEHPEVPYDHREFLSFADGLLFQRDLLLIHMHNPLPNEIRRGSTLGHVFWSEAIVIPRSIAVKTLRLRTRCREMFFPVRNISNEVGLVKSV